ncbi:MAG: hypothetical protein K6T83_16420 [Alicyclobacillus sp.]|nr:hypothetical protein [Alicyclobacillus sp.]
MKLRRVESALCMLGSLLTFILTGPYALAANAPVVRIHDESIFLVPAPVVHLLDVMVVAKFSNPSHQKADVVIPVPVQAQKLEVSGAPASAWHSDEHSVVLRHWLAGGQTRELTVSYALPFNSAAGRQLALRSNYAIALAHVYIPEGSVSLSAPGLQVATQTVTVSGTTFRVFTRGGISAGTWRLSLLPLPGLASGPSTGDLPVLAGPDHQASDARQALENLAVAAFVLLLGLLGIRTGNLPRTGAASESERTRALYQGWHALEEAHMTGTVDDEAYAKRRRMYLEQLVALRQAEGNREGVQDDVDA